MAELNSKVQGGKWTNPVLSFEEPKSNTAKSISNYALASKGIVTTSAHNHYGHCA